MAVYINKISRMFNSRVKPHTFNIGDLVFKRTNIIGSSTRFGKLGKNWKEPFRISKVIRSETYKLTKLDGRVIVHS